MIAVYDPGGDITGCCWYCWTKNIALEEIFTNRFKKANAKTTQGSNNYYSDVIFAQSQFIYWTDHLAAGSNWGTDIASGTDYTLVSGVDVSALTGGTDDYATTNGEIALAYDKFKDTESLDINLVIGGSSSIAADTAANMDTHVTMITALVNS